MLEQFIRRDGGMLSSCRDIEFHFKSQPLIPLPGAILKSVFRASLRRSPCGPTAPPKFLCAELPWYNAMAHQTGSESSVHVLSCPMPRSWLWVQCLELPVQADSYIEALCTASVSPAGRRIIPACFKLFIWNHCRLVLNFVLSLSFTLPFGLKDLRLRTQPYLPLHIWSKDSCSSCILKASDPFYPILTKCFCRVFIADCRKEAENTPPVTVKGELNPTL